MKHNKIPYQRFCYESCAVDGKYFKEIEKVSADDIKSLSPHELNKITLLWLYDWAEVHDLLGIDEVRHWLEQIRQNRTSPRTLQLSHGKNKVGFIGVEGDNRIYTANYKDYYLSGGRIHCGYITFAPSPEQMKRLNDMFRTFLMITNRQKQAKCLVVLRLGQTNYTFAVCPTLHINLSVAIMMAM